MNPINPTNQLKRITRSQIVARVLLCLAGAAGAAIGCGWNGTSHSVRFNAYQGEREMDRLPPLPTLANGMNDLRVTWQDDDPLGVGEDNYTVMENRNKQVDDLWERAEVAERDGNLQLDRELLNEYLKRTEIRRGGGWFGPTVRQQRRNAATDQLNALGALEHGSKASRVVAYLHARRLYDADKPVAEEVNKALELVPSDVNLNDNVAYLKAAELYRQEEFEEAGKAFAALTRRFPGSEKREAALFMAAVATMKNSTTYIAASGNSDYEEGAHGKFAADQEWQDAFAGFQKVMKEYPRGNYFDEARGWLAYLMLRNHDRAGALVEYYRLLAARQENTRIEAAFSLGLVRSSATEDEISQVEKQLAKEPEAALAYAYHNIYNYAIDPGESDPPYDQNREQIKDSKGQINYEAEQRRSEWLEKEWKQARNATSRKELNRTLNFSKKLMAHYPGLAVGGAFALRAAQASEELEDNQTAVEFSRRALKGRLDNDQRAQALWTLGVAEHRLRHFDEARKSFTTLLRDYPQTRLTEGARRLLAMIAEDAGDIDLALEQYVALDYDLDVGYFVDRLMTTEQLAGFIQRHPGFPKRNEFTYALGVRYLRAKRWDDARKTLGQVATSNASSHRSYFYAGNCTHGSNSVFNDERTNAFEQECVDPKDGALDEENNPIITASLVMRDIQTANDLEALERRVEQADGDEAKAEALYQFASYQYESSSLLFYNPLASPGYWNLSLLASEGKYRVVNEAQMLFESTQEHEKLARALDVYLELVNRFPRTRAARDALYTAAVCHERLSGYNPYWREIYQNGLHAGQRMVTYEDVKAAYPNYQLPRGTNGWQPSARTVNGGPGWEPKPKPPKPQPRLTRTARLERFVTRLGLSLNRVAYRLQMFWREDGRRWATEFVILLLLLGTARVAARNRRRLRAQIARHRIAQSRQTTTYPWLELFWIDHVEPSRREQVKKFLGDKREEFIELAKDRRSQPVLVRNIVSHSLMAGLLISLIWTAW
jgi:TolA-binding protein